MESKRANRALLIVATSGLLVAGGFLAGQGNRPAVVGVCGGENRIFRVYDNGDVDFLDINTDAGVTARGVPDWKRLKIDRSR